ncbi:hypothetical protein ABGB09_29620 [Streptomyces sp. B8F3]|uniref:hypothetical protein n=1 Tax=Streptomyces sp. B8F3 TaxID=3153573 RepID=UPI00325C4060
MLSEGLIPNDPPHAVVTGFADPDAVDETCEVCFARLAIGTFNLEGVETLACRGCSEYRTADNAEIVPDTAA